MNTIGIIIMLFVCACGATPHSATTILPHVPHAVDVITVEPTLLFPGELHVRRDPNQATVASVASVSLHQVPFHSITFTMQLSPAAYGADAYTNIYLNGVLWAEVGINGLDHWNRNPCNSPNARDSRFFIGLAAYNPAGNSGSSAKWTNDVAVDFPSSRVSDAPTTFTVASDDKYIRFYVDGVELTYRDTGNVYPAGGFGNVASFLPTALNDVKFEVAVLGDGRSTSTCGDTESPFIPGTGPVSAEVVWSNVVIR